MSKIAIHFRLDGSVRQLLGKIAERERRTMTHELEALIIARAKELGLIPQDWAPGGDVAR